MVHRPLRPLLQKAAAATGTSPWRWRTWARLAARGTWRTALYKPSPRLSDLLHQREPAAGDAAACLGRHEAPLSPSFFRTAWGAQRLQPAQNPRKNKDTCTPQAAEFQIRFPGPSL